MTADSQFSLLHHQTRNVNVSVSVWTNLWTLDWDK